MTFINLQVDTDDIPRAADLEMEPMAPAYAREVLTQQLIAWGVISLVSIIPYLLVVRPETLKNYLALLPLAAILLALLVIALVIKQVRVKAFAVREHDIAYRAGLFWRKTIVLAYDRIQHIEVTTGPLQRKFGLASLKFFTAGGSSVDLRIDGLNAERAAQLREFILQRNIDTANHP
jgi:membrane protein YdbS with pleckstrin-like domain